MKKITPILNRLKQITNSKTDKELTQKLGISYSTLDTWKNRDKIPEKRLLEFSLKYQVPMEWLLTGEGEMYKTPSVQNSIIAQGNNHNIIGNVVGSNIQNNEMLKKINETFLKLPPNRQEVLFFKIMNILYEELDKIKEKEEWKIKFVRRLSGYLGIEYEKEINEKY